MDADPAGLSRLIRTITIATDNVYDDWAYIRLTCWISYRETHTGPFISGWSIVAILLATNTWFNGTYEHRRSLSKVGNPPSGSLSVSPMALAFG